MSNQQGGHLVEAGAEFAAFDLLPAAVQQSLRYAWFKYSALDCFVMLANGMPAEGIRQQIRRMDAQRAGEP